MPGLEDDIERVIFHEAAIHGRLDEIARRITADYAGKELTVLAVLNGSLIFVADLLRRIPLPLKLDCISVSSYHGGVESTGNIVFDQISMPDIHERHVLIVDDILDTGQTLDAIRRKLSAEARPRTVKICVLLRKVKARLVAVEPDYVAFDIADEFVVGYGLDYREKYRNLPFVGVPWKELLQPKDGGGESPVEKMD